MISPVKGVPSDSLSMVAASTTAWAGLASYMVVSSVIQARTAAFGFRPGAGGRRDVVAEQVEDRTELVEEFFR
jgi:hypothetical protein